MGGISCSILLYRPFKHPPFFSHLSLSGITFFYSSFLLFFLSFFLSWGDGVAGLAVGGGSFFFSIFTPLLKFFRFDGHGRGREGFGIFFQGIDRPFSSFFLLRSSLLLPMFCLIFLFCILATLSVWQRFSPLGWAGLWHDGGNAFLFFLSFYRLNVVMVLDGNVGREWSAQSSLLLEDDFKYQNYNYSTCTHRENMPNRTPKPPCPTRRKHSRY